MAATEEDWEAARARLEARMVAADTPRGTGGALRADGDYEALDFGGDLTRSSFPNARLELCRFDDVHLDACMGRGARLHECVFESTSLANADLSESMLNDTALRSTRCLGTDLGGAELRDVVFTDCSLELASFRFARLTRVTFDGCDLRETDFQGAVGSTVRFHGCTFARTEFSQSRFTGGEIFSPTVESVHGIEGLRGMAIDAAALYALAPALAGAAGLRLAD